LVYKNSLMAERKRYELWAEAIRDIGILTLVFVPLDSLIRETPITRARLLMDIGFAILGLLLIEIGVRMEFNS
jgi:hypothetical protein